MMPPPLRLLFLLTLLIPSCGSDSPPPPPVAEVVASGVGPTWRYGVEPGLAVHKVEDHSDALLFWLRQGTRGRRVLHIDTHDDARLIDPAVLPEVERSVAAEDWTALHDHSGVSFQSAPKWFNIGNFLYLGWKLGVVREVVWVLPGQRQDLADLNRVQGWLQVIGFDSFSARTFHREGPILRGQRSGMPMVLCTADAIPPDDEPTLLSLDIDYLVGHFRDEDQTPMRDLILELHAWLRSSGLVTDSAVISYSVHGGSIPLIHKYAGDYFESLILNPEIEQQPPAHWQLRVDAQRARTRGQAAGALTLFDQAIAAAPRDASLRLDRAMLQLEQGDLDGACDSLAIARDLDPPYFLSYVECAWAIREQSAFANIDRNAWIDRLMQEAASVFPIPHPDGDHAGLGADWLRKGDFRRAQVEHFKLVRESVPATALAGFQPQTP